jgi:ABC-type transporter Mla subunit MlaD
VFDEVKTLAVGAKVAVAGRRVGEVSSLRWTEQAYDAEDVAQLRRQLGTLPDGVREGARRLVVEVQFALSDTSLRLDPATAQAALMQEGLLGQHFLELHPGSWSDGDQPPPILAAGHAQPLTIRARRGGGIDRLAATVGQAVASIDALTRTLNDDVLTAANRDSFTGLLGDLRDAAGDLRRLLAAGSTDGLQATTLQPLRDLIDTTARTVVDARRMLQEDLTPVLVQLEGTLADARPELADSLRRLRSTLWQAEMALRKVRANPSVLLFGTDEADLEAREFDESGVRATGRARIYRQRDESAAGR